MRSIPGRVSSIVNYRADMEHRIEDLEERLQWFVEHTDIRTLKPATGYLRNKQLNLVKFANDFFETISELDIHPFLIGGNLIGAYRHKGFVPWDDDLDFGLMRDEYEKLINYCKEKFIVEVYDGKLSEYSPDRHIARLDNVVKEHPNDYILDIWVDQIQITRGTSCIDRLAIDFWAYDFYADDYPIEEHANYLRYLSKKKREIDYVNNIIEFLEIERKKNPFICDERTTKVFPGIDNVAGYLRVDRFKDWNYSDDVFPLKKFTFETAEYFAPKIVEKWLEFEYPDYMSYPADVGRTPHEGYKERYIVNNMPYAEFYLVDSFEIYHFLPLYHFFERNGIYAYFVAEKPDIQDAWFDYDVAIRILETNGVRYKRTPNYNADYVFTTQDEYLINKYMNKKIHMCYGVGLTSYSFCESERTINNFDLKLVHGECSYDIVRRKNQSLQMIKVGYPRYAKGEKSEFIYSLVDKQNQILEKNVHNKPILLYFPTWDKASSIDAYADGFRKLKENYFIITKAHHCTFRLESEKEHRDILNEISDVILEGNFSFEEAVHLGDLAVCDAVSGAATEVPYLNKNEKLILLYSPIEEKNQFKEFIDNYAVHVTNADELVNAIGKMTIKDPFIEERNRVIHSLYESNTDRGLQQLKEYLLNNCRKRG